MTLSDGTVFGTGRVRRVSRTEGDGYRALLLSFSNCSLELRCYDDGFAWRWRAPQRKSYEVVGEQASFRPADDWPVWVSYTQKNDTSLESQFEDDFENVYARVPLSGWDRGHLGVLPVLVEAPQGVKMVFAESDVVSYPGMFLYPATAEGLEGRFAAYPKREQQGGHNELQFHVCEREAYIARCDGTARNFPWRVVCVSREDRQLAANRLVDRIATPCPAGEDFSWVKPGKVAWDWLCQYNLRGMDFVPGVNTPTYKAFIDFASRHGIEYVILDEGWAVKYADDLMQIVPEIDLPEIIAYGASKGVDIILWAGYSAFAKDIEGVCRHYAALGVKGFKVDFLDRNDQKMMDFMRKTAETAARYRLVVDFHGCPPPCGWQKRYPNILNYEGIFGLEQMRKRPFPEFDMVKFDVCAPFIRFLAGPADYTPGAFRNATAESWYPVKNEPISQGTRCRQLAEYVLFDAPLQMLCESPSLYELEPQCAEFLYRVPTVWDETRVLEGKLGEYIVTARRKGTTWYVGALTDWMPRDLTLDLSALAFPATGAESVSVQIEAWEDGPVADRIASDWKKRTFTTDSSIRIHLAPGGGWAAIVSFAPENKKKYTPALDLTVVGKFIDTLHPWDRINARAEMTQGEKNQTRNPSGLALSFRTNSKTIGVRVKWRRKAASGGNMGPIAARGFDLYMKTAEGLWRFAGNGYTKEVSPGDCHEVTLVPDAGHNEKDCLLYLPIFSEIESLDIITLADSWIKSGPQPFRNRIAVFGSSFTQGSGASRCAMTWEAQLSRETGYNFINLGFSGNSKLQSYFADALLEATDVDAYVFDAFSNPTPKEVEERLEPFIKKFVTARPGVPLIFLQTIRREKRNFSESYERKERNKQENAERIMRQMVKKYKDVYWVNTTNATSERHEATSDGSHPDAYGYMLWMESVKAPLMEILNKYFNSN